jgi:hypothetical protein
MNIEKRHILKSSHTP